MSGFRLYLVDEKGTIQAREEFEAPDDDIALLASDLVCRACSDACHGYELWQDARQVIAFDSPISSADRLAVLTDAQTVAVQQIAVALEEALRRSHWPMARSEKLISETEVLKQRIAQIRAEPNG